MLDHQTIVVGSEIDIINARMLVRQAARRIGMKLIDQSRISLATSSIADSIGLGVGRSAGQITINCLHANMDGREGLQIICQFKPTGLDSVNPSLSSVRWMVDECDMRSLPNNETEVSLVKWLS